MSEQPAAGPLPQRPIGYDVKVPGFEGPLDLLVTLAHQGKIDLATISLADLTAELLDRTKRNLDLNEATEALWMLAALVEMKAKLLLPKIPPTEPLPDTSASDLPERLEEQLTEYRAFKDAAQALKALEDFQQRVFQRAAQIEVPGILLEGLTADDLFTAFQAVLTRVRKIQAAEMADELVRVSDRKTAILQALRRSTGGLEFAGLFPSRASVVFVVVTFLALLELIKERLVRVQQASPLAPIVVMIVTP